jgi:4-methyl-5(b-hydroxyethyl)-thiazole monophosphate biosynthesis
MLAKKKYVTGLCTGPAVLSDAGVLDGKEATCYVTGCKKLKKMPERPPFRPVIQPVVESGQIITGQDARAAGPFTETLVRRLRSER